MEKESLFFLSLQKERAIGVETADALELERGADGRELSIGFSKVVHQTSPRPCGGGKSVVNRPAELAEPVVKPVDSSRSMRSPVPAAAGFLFLLLFLFRFIFF